MAEPIKCLVWDLDNTLWQGTLLESDACRLRPGARAVLAELDRRGVLLSIASANDPGQALDVLRRKGLAHLFLHPQIGWESKVRGLRAIADALDVALGALGFIDDEPFELERVRRMLPDVRPYPADAYRTLPELPEFDPGAVSEESRTRRVKYVRAVERERERRTAGMSHSEFLAHCAMRLTLRPAAEADLPRVLELLRRTHQLNSTGVAHDAAEVAAWLRDPGYRVFVAALKDRFVDYGRIGVAVCRLRPGAWELIAFLLSCRVLSRGISGFVLGWVERQAALDGAKRFRGRYRRTARNHRMENLYRLAGLKLEDRLKDGTLIYGARPPDRLRPPRWLAVEEGGAP